VKLQKMERLLKAKGFVTALYDDPQLAEDVLGTYVVAEDKNGDARALPLFIEWSHVHSCWKFISAPFLTIKQEQNLIPLLDTYNHFGLIPLINYEGEGEQIWIGAWRLIEVSEDTLVDKVWAFMECISLWLEAVEERYSVKTPSQEGIQHNGKD